MLNVIDEGWKEVKAVSVSAVTHTVDATTGERAVALTQHSYRAGLWDAATFAPHHWAEACRRGVDNAKAVVCVSDGAAWIWASSSCVLPCASRFWTGGMRATTLDDCNDPMETITATCYNAGMQLNRDYRPIRRRGFWGRLWPALLIVAAIGLYQLRSGQQVPSGVVSAPAPTPDARGAAANFTASAQRAMLRGDYAAALADYQSLATLQPANPEPLVLQAQLYLIVQDVDAAYAAASEAVGIAPHNAAALTILARTEDWRGELHVALRDALAALEIDKDNVETLAVLGEIYADLGDWERAEENIRKALTLAPNNVLALRNQAYLYERQGNYQQAVDMLGQALIQYPRRYDLLLEKARIYRSGLDDYAQALNAYQSAVDVHRSAVTLDALGEALYSGGEHALAVRTLREAVDLDSQYGLALIHLGMALYARNNFEEAAANLERGLALIDHQAGEKYYDELGLAYIYQEPRACDRAVPWLQKALEHDVQNVAAQKGMSICAAEQATAQVTS